MGSSEPSRVRQWALESCLTLTPPPRQKWPTEPAEARPPGNTGVRGQAWALGPVMGSGAPLGSTRTNYLPCVYCQVWPLQCPLRAKPAIVAGAPSLLMGGPWCIMLGGEGAPWWSQSFWQGSLGKGSCTHFPEGCTQGRRGGGVIPGPCWKQAGPLCAPALYLPPRPGVTWSSAPFPHSPVPPWDP